MEDTRVRLVSASEDVLLVRQGGREGRPRPNVEPSVWGPYIQGPVDSSDTSGDTDFSSRSDGNSPIETLGRKIYCSWWMKVRILFSMNQYLLSLSSVYVFLRLS